MGPEPGLGPLPIKGSPARGLPPRADSIGNLTDSSIAARPSHRRAGSGPETARYNRGGSCGESMPFFSVQLFRYSMSELQQRVLPSTCRAALALCGPSI